MKITPLLIGWLWCSQLVWAQPFFSIKFADSKKADVHYQALQSERKSILTELQPVQRQLFDLSLSEEQHFLLNDLFRNVFTGKDKYAKRFLETYQYPYQSIIEKVYPIDSLLLMEKELGILNEALEQYQYMYLRDNEWERVGMENSEGLKKELAVYQFGRGEQVLEIGAGDEDFMLAVADLDLDIQFFANEVDPLKLKRLFYQATHHPKLALLHKSIKVVQGTDANTGMSRQKVDKIIIRNAIHHFSKPQSMLVDIEKQLKESGKLYIVERYADQCKDQCCEHLMSEAGIKGLFAGSAFMLRAEHVIQYENGWVYHILEYGNELNE